MHKNGIIIFSGIILAFIAFLVWYVRGEKQVDVNTYGQINSFEECAAAGFPIQESYPERCATPDGRSFTKQY